MVIKFYMYVLNENGFPQVFHTNLYEICYLFLFNPSHVIQNHHGFVQKEGNFFHHNIDSLGSYPLLILKFSLFA